MGTCVSMGLSVDGKDPREAQKDVDAGVYDDILTEQVLSQFKFKIKLISNSVYDVIIKVIIDILFLIHAIVEEFFSCNRFS